MVIILKCKKIEIKNFKFIKIQIQYNENNAISIN